MVTVVDDDYPLEKPKAVGPAPIQRRPAPLVSETIGDNTSLAVVKRGLKVAENEVLFYKYGLLLRTHQKAMEASLIRQRAEEVRRSEVDSQGRLGRWS